MSASRCARRIWQGPCSWRSSGFCGACSEAGTPVDEWRRVRLPAPVRRSADEIESEVLIVDAFGNLVSALRTDEIDGSLADWVVEVAGREVPCAGTYAEVGAGEPLALVDSYGHLEIAVRDGDAARELGVERGAPVILRRRT